MVITIKFRIISSPVAGLASVPSSASSARQVESFLSYPSLKGNRHAKYKLEQAPFNQAVFSVVWGAVQRE